MIYLKRFDTHNNYSAFTETTDFIEPNVSTCEDSNHVHYNPLEESLELIEEPIGPIEKPDYPVIN